MVFSFRNLSGVKVFLKRTLENQATEQDHLIIFSGREGSGKSSCMLHCIDIRDHYFGEDTPISHIGMTLSDFNLAWSKSKKFDLLALDEGKELMAMNYSDSEVKKFEQLMTRIRKEGHLYFICVTNPFRLIRYIREDKLFAVFFCDKRGHVKIFTGDQFWKLLQKNKDDRSLKLLQDAKPRFQDTFPIYKGKLADDYLHMKDASMSMAKKKIENELSAKVETMSVNQAYKRLKITFGRLKDLIKEGKIRAYVDGAGKFKPYVQDIIAYEASMQASIKIHKNEALRSLAQNPKKNPEASGNANNNKELLKGFKQKLDVLPSNHEVT